MKILSKVLLYGISGNAITVDIGISILRISVGLAFMTIFEKFLPRDGVWGPQQWFIDDVSKMGFPAPVLFAWIAVVSEFIGGFFLILGFGTRVAAFLNACVTFVAAFVYHHADISKSGLAATTFFMMCVAITIMGPGRYSLDALFARNSVR